MANDSANTDDATGAEVVDVDSIGADAGEDSPTDAAIDQAQSEEDGQAGPVADTPDTALGGDGAASLDDSEDGSPAGGPDGSQSNDTTEVIDAPNDSGAETTGEDGDAVALPDTATDLTGQPCDDGNACTSQDQWSSGQCLGTWQSCEDGNPCTTDLCNPKTAACTHVAASGACDDGNVCTQGETCSGAKGCGDGGPTSCDDGLPCTTDSCVPKVGCVHTVAKVGQDCGGGAVCIASGACAITTSCQGMPALCDDGEQCTIDFCEPQAGCIHLVVPDKSACDDGDSCTPFATDRCYSGSCTNLTNVCGCQIDSDCAQFDDGNLCNGIYACIAQPDGKKQCKPKLQSQVQCAQPGSSACHTATCDPETGLCLATPVSDNAWCDDGEPCTAKSLCAKGTCQGFGATACDDGNPCTADSCTPGSGCVNQPTSSGSCACPGCDDNNPCTIDTCFDDGGCGHSPQTCNTGGDPCLTAACVATGPKTWICAQQPKSSVAPLSPAVPCKVSATVGDCPTGYQCLAPADMPEAATCQPKLSIPCSDGNACTGADTCANGSCLPGPPVGCDDDNPCTADSCASATCIHTPLAGCKVCVQEGFQTDAYWSQWASETDWEDYVSWEVAQEVGGNLRQVAQWKGPFTKANINQGAHLFARRLHLGPGVPSQLDFWLRASLGTQTCGSDDLEVRVNGTMVWRLCKSTPGGSQGNYQHVTLDLAAFAGSPVDIEFRVLAGAEAGAAGKIELDKVRVAGACSEACMGGHLEALATARDVPSSAVPQGWKLTSSDPDYVAWGRTYTGGQHGLGAMTAHWTGKPASGKSQTAQLRVPLVNPAADSKLHFAVRGVFAGDSSCTTDVLVAKIAGVKVFELCSAQTKWKYQAIDLSPWAGKDVDVVFEVKTGGTASSLGLFQIDDLSLTGACSYACFYSDFEAADSIDQWWKGNTTNAPAWTPMAPAGEISGHLKAQLPAALPKGAMTTLMPTDKWRWQMPINGASFELKAQLTGEASTCPAVQFRTRLVYEYRGIAPTDPKEVLTSPYMFDLVKLCETGQETFKVEIGDPIRGKKFLPLFVLEKGAGLGAGQGGVSVQVDDFAIRCR